MGYMEKELKSVKGLEEVREGIFIIKNMNFPSSNSIVIQDQKTVLIDTGSRGEILKKLSDEVDMILNSHYHHDHIKYNSMFDKVHINEVEAPALEGPDRYLDVCGVSDQEIKNTMKESFLSDRLWVKNVTPFTFDQVLDFGKTQWEPIHTPGHSPGHCCLYEQGRNILFVGDYGPENFGPWYGWPCCNLEELVESIEKIIEIDPELVLSSHTEPLTEGIREEMERYRSILFGRDEKISNLKREGKNIEEIMEENVFYNEDLRSVPAFQYFEKTMIKKHLEADI